ncbi:MAG: hypothetical protein QGH15_21060, partial [Kiritimatiellia bacterium]|nr:hypothetical protein [Kiritimatiellia bacterium]
FSRMPIPKIIKNNCNFTIFNRTLVTWTCESAGMQEMEMSSSFGEALSRAGTEQIMSGPLGLFFGVGRASNAAGKVAGVQAAAARHAAFIDELSTEGIEASTNIEQLLIEASEAGTVATVGAPVEEQPEGTGPDGTEPEGQAPAAHPAPAKTEPEKITPHLVASRKNGAGNGTLIGAVANGVGGLFNSDKEDPPPAYTDTQEPDIPVTPAKTKEPSGIVPAESGTSESIPLPITKSQSGPPKLTSLADVTISSEVVDPLESIPEEKREDWAMAESMIKVSGVMRSGTNRYTVLIRGEVIVKGETTDVDHENETYTFKLISVNNRDICTWAPVPSSTNAAGKNADFVPFR